MRLIQRCSISVDFSFPARGRSRTKCKNMIAGNLGEKEESTSVLPLCAARVLGSSFQFGWLGTMSEFALRAS